MSKSKKPEKKLNIPKEEKKPKAQPTLEEVNEEKLKLARQEVIDRNPTIKFP